VASIRFQLDEHVSPAVAQALRQHGIDVVTSAEAGLLGAPDTLQLDHALRTGHVVVTLDRDFLRLDHEGHPHAGIAFFPRGSRAIGHIVESLDTVFGVMEPSDMSQRVEYL